MKPERAQEIDRVFADALERKPEERASFLDAACRDDSELRREVESLLANEVPDTIVGSKAAEVATQLLTPQGLSEIGPYKIVRSLGAGGMGQVFLAHDKRLKRNVAVKLISQYTGGEEEKVRRFRQEALAASALNHPNILTIYEIGEVGGSNFIATEFVDGRTLRELIDDNAISMGQSLDVAKQVATALSAAHAAGIVHRDIKPANIMIRADGLVKILDFGVAKFTQPNEASNESFLETTPGTVVGTAAYMSPEQARGNQIDNRTDLWSLGVILYEMITGRRPFEGETTLDLMSAIIARQPLPLSAGGKTVPPLLKEIILKALEKDPDLRYQDAAELLVELQELTKISTSDVRETRSTIDPQTSKDKTLLTPTSNANPVDKRQWLIPLVLGSLLVLLLIVAGLLYRSYLTGQLPIKSIAVLPFKNESNNSDLEYLAEGMPETLINSLSQLRHLSVKSRSSVMRYKGRDIEPQRVASELSVQAVLEGRVVQRGDNLTISLSLVDGSNGNQVWGETYDRKLSQLITLQNEIARDVSQKLRVQLSRDDQQKLAKDYTANAEAYQLYLKGHFHIQKLTPADSQLGLSYFQQAINLDQNYALAYVGLAEANRSFALGSERNPVEYFPRAKAAAEKALQLDESLPDAHSVLGTILFWYDRNWNEAENHYKRALELNPKTTAAHLFYAHLLSNTGRQDEMLVEIKRARELEPTSPLVNSLEGQFLVHAGRADEALTRLKEASALAPGFWFPHLFASSAYIDKGMYAEAIAEARRATELSGAQTGSRAMQGYALAKWGKIDEARAVLDELIKFSQEKDRWVPPYHMALVCNGLGKSDEAITWLEKGIEQHDPKINFLKVEPKWNNLRGDPRFQDIMRRAGF